MQNIKRSKTAVIVSGEYLELYQAGDYSTSASMENIVNNKLFINWR